MNEKDQLLCKQFRRQIFTVGYRGGMAHLASCFSQVEIVYTLYAKIMKHDPKNPGMPDRDRFILSKGHGALALYAVLCHFGYLTLEEFRSYLQPECHIGGEPCMRDFPGIEATTGSLGHGLSVGTGMALAQKLDGNGAKTYVLLGDGECEEGSIWEAAMSAAALKLHNLVAILDCNQIQKCKTVSEIVGTPDWKEKWSSFGWNVLEADGHDTDDLERALRITFDNQAPTLILAHTVKGKGVSLMENSSNWHFKIPGKKERKIFQAELEITDSELETGILSEVTQE